MPETQQKARIEEAASSAAPAVAPTDTLTDPLQDQELGSITMGGSKRTYEAALGEFLGGELHKVVSKELSRAKLEKLARGAVDDAFKQVRGWVKDQVSPSEAAIADKLSGALTKALAPKVQDLVADTGIADALSSYALESPRTMLAAALAGVATYIATNQDLPTLKKRLGLGKGHDLRLSLDLGSTLDIAVQKLGVAYAYKSGGTSASVKGEVDFDEDSKSVEALFKHQDDDSSLSLSGAYTEQGDNHLLKGAAAYQNDNVQARLFGQTGVQDGRRLDQLGVGVGAKWGDESGSGAWTLEGRAIKHQDGRDELGGMLGYKLSF